MRKLYGTLFALGLLALSSLSALAADCTTQIGGFQADNVTFYAGGQGCPPAGATFKPMGVIYSTIATAGTAAGTSEQVLATYSLPAGALDVTGRKLHVHVSFSAAANGNNKTFKLYFGASVITSGVLTTNAKNGYADLYVTKSGSSTQIVSGSMTVDTTQITPYVNASGADADTAAIVVKFSGTDGTSSANDIVMNDFFIEYMN